MSHLENQEYSVNNLVKILLEESDSYTKEHLKSVINLLIKKEGSLFHAIKKCGYTSDKLFELVIKKSENINEETLKALKSVIDDQEGGLEKFIEREKDKGGKIFFTFNDIKISGVGKTKWGILYLTDKKIFFIPKKIKYKGNSTIWIGMVIFFGGIGRIYGILGAALGGGFGAFLAVGYDKYFNKPKIVEQYDLPLTLQVAYSNESFQVDLNNIREVVVNSKKNSRIAVMSSDKKQNCGFDLKQYNTEKIIDFLNKNNIQTRNVGSIISEYKKLRK